MSPMPCLSREELLWSAPEILRSTDKVLPGSAKGDVYGFGIILEEIILRGGPYEEASMVLTRCGWRLTAIPFM